MKPIPTILLVTAFFAIKANAQTDPRKTPGESVKVLNVGIIKKLRKDPLKPTVDSVADVKVQYIKPDCSVGELLMKNVGYSNSPVNHDKEQKPSKNKN